MTLGVSQRWNGGLDGSHTTCQRENTARAAAPIAIDRAAVPEAVLYCCSEA